jgi:hypothetical protein
VGQLDEEREAMRLRHLILPVVLILLICGASSEAHVGSPDIFFEGKAGPYNVIVSIQPPDVVPGIAQIMVRADDNDISRVTVQPVYFRTGREGAPRPDEALRTESDPRSFIGKLWLMEFGSSSVNVNVEGGAGTGSVIVPVPAIATARRGIDAKLGILLAGLGLFLFVGAVAVIGACAREAITAPGSEVTSERRKRSRLVMIITGAVIIGAILLGDKWWGFVDSRYLVHMYKPISVAAGVRNENSQSLLRLTLSNTEWLDRKTSDFIPDHGKLMHLFLIREPSLDAFAHLHPAKVGDDTFDVALPPIPEGKYRLYADVVHENGMAETLTATVDAPSGIELDKSSSMVAADPDDAWRVGGEHQGSAQQLSDGSTMTWEHTAEEPFAAGRLESLRFSVKPPDGSPAALEPYMGMQGHAVITRDDGAVFVHVHPVGTVSMASQQAFADLMGAAKADENKKAKDAGDNKAASIDNSSHSESNPHHSAGGSSDMRAMDHSAHTQSPTATMNKASAASNAQGEVSFPYSFPKPGRYRLWVQVKREGRVLTGVFDADVK